MKSGAKKAVAPIAVKKQADAQALKEQEAKFRSTFVEAMRSSSPPRSEPVVLPEAIVVPGLTPPAMPKPLPLVQQAPKPAEKIAPAKVGAKKGAAKAGAAKSGSKSAAKTGVKSGAKTGTKSGAKVGNLIMKRVEPLNLDSLTSREPEKEEEEKKAQTSRIEVKNEFSVQTEEIKQGVDEGIQGGDFQEYLKNQNMKNLTCETVPNTGLSIASKVPPVIKLLQTLSFKRILKPCPDLYFCESVHTVYSTELRPAKDIKLANLNIKKFSVLTKPPIGLFYSEQFAFRVISKPIPKLSYTEKVISSHSVLTPPQRNLYQLGTMSLEFGVIFKPEVPLYFYIPSYNLPLAPTIEVIEDFDLSKCSLKTIKTLAFSYQTMQKPVTEVEFDEDCFTSKHKSIVPSIRLMKNLQVEEEDWKIRRGPPVIEILNTMEFQVISKPEVDFWFYQKEFVEMCLQTEEILEPIEEEKKDQIPTDEVLSFDEFFSKLEITTPKNSAEPTSFQFVDQALTKLSEMENLKKEVKERENLKFKRNKAAVIIQAWARGVLARRKYIPPILEVYKDRLRKRKLAELAVRIKRSWAPYVILNALQCWYRMKQREKQRLYRLFLNFSATNIQRFWRGYVIRRFYREKILTIALAKRRIRKLVRDWKCKKIMRTRRIRHIIKGINDTKNVLSDLSRDRSSYKLVQQLKSQLNSYISKLRSDFNTLYISGKWANLPIYRDSSIMAETTTSLKFPQEETEEPIHVQSSFLNRDDIPIRPLAMNYEDLLKDFPEQPLTSPPPQVRKKKIPVKKIDFKKKEEEKIKEKSPEVFVFNENLEEVRQDDVQKPSGKPKEFLKRKSKAIKPQKIEWNVARRIDCWLPKEKFKKKEISYEIQRAMPRGDFLRLEDIEKEFQDDLSGWISLELFFDRETKGESKIPQLDMDSKCLRLYMESNYTMYIEELESHYTYLCSEDVLSG